MIMREIQGAVDVWRRIGGEMDKGKGDYKVVCPAVLITKSNWYLFNIQN